MTTAYNRNFANISADVGESRKDSQGEVNNKINIEIGQTNKELFGYKRGEISMKVTHFKYNLA